MISQRVTESLVQGRTAVPVWEPQHFISRGFGDRNAGRAHLVGIGGSGMRSLAEVLLGWGCRVSGSDTRSAADEPLARAGVRLFSDHAAENLARDVGLVVSSDAVPADVPELRRARALGIPTQSYFEAIGHLMAVGRIANPSHKGLAVAGTHGKSTVTAMAGQLLVDAGLDPTVLCGAVPVGCESGGRAGRGPVMLVEACEYRANFLHLRPRQAVILGIEPDHFDCYRSPGELEQAFAQFRKNVPSDGLLLARRECPATSRVAAGPGCRVQTFGFDPRADWSARHVTDRRGRFSFAMFRHDRRVCDVRLRVPGRHNAINALAAGALAWEQGVPAEAIAAGLSRFRGVRRRLELLGNWRGGARLDDFAHHPTEVAAALGAVRQMYPGRRVWCVFQPHQASRTEHLLDELAQSLQNADKVVVAQIFRAREGKPKPHEVTAADLAEQVRGRGAWVRHFWTRGHIVGLLRTRLRPSDVLITMGAGDIGRIQDELADRLREDRAAG